MSLTLVSSHPVCHPHIVCSLSFHTSPSCIHFCHLFFNPFFGIVCSGFYFVSYPCLICFSLCLLTSVLASFYLILSFLQFWSHLVSPSPLISFFSNVIWCVLLMVSVVSCLSFSCLFFSHLVPSFLVSSVLFSSSVSSLSNVLSLPHFSSILASSCLVSSHLVSLSLGGGLVLPLFSSLLLLFILFRSHLVSHTCLISSHLVCPSCLYYFLSRLSSSCLLLLISTISFLISSFLFHFLSHMFNSHQASHPFLSSSPCFNSCLVLSLVFSSYLFFSSYLVSHAYLSTSSFRFLI